MEDIPKFVQDDSSDDSSLDGSGDVEIKFYGGYNKLQAWDLKSLSNPHRGDSKARMPTRRPDPNVYNRNALMARENRRKKKAYLETIEKELEQTRCANKALSKALKKQVKVAQRLEQEKIYFKNILANHSEIFNIVSKLQDRPLKQSAISTKQRDLSSPSYDGSQASSWIEGSSSSSYDTEAAYNSGRVAATQDSCTSKLSSSVNLLDFSLDFDATAFNDTWNELMDENFGLKHLGESGSVTPMENQSYNIGVDHSYVSPPASLEAKDGADPGICLHISNGKLSLEFCPSCHWSSCNTLPTQLLSEEPAN